MVHITGLASGIDIDNLIDQLIAIESRPITLWQNEINTYQLQLDAFRDINTRLTNLQGTLTDLINGTSFGQMSATSSDTSFLTASASSSAQSATYKIKINTLAAQHTVISEQTNNVANFNAQINGNDVNLNPAGVFDATTPLANFNGGAGVSTTSLTMTVGNTTKTIDVSAAVTAGDIETAIETAFSNVTVSYNDGGAGNQYFVVDVTDQNKSIKITENSDVNTLGLGGTTGKSDRVFQIKTEADASYFEVFLNGDISFSGIANAINSVSGKTFTASILNNRLVIASDKVGASNGLQFIDNSPLTNTGILDQLDILIEDNADSSTINNEFASDQTQGGVLQADTDASFTVNSVPVTRDKNTGIDDVISGVTLNLLKADAGATEITLTIDKDTQAALDDIKSFVDQYNSVISLMQSLTQYNSITEEAGDLQGNFTANSMMNQLYDTVTTLYDYTEMTFKSLFQVTGDDGTAAFTIGEINTSQEGLIVIDETALTEALERDPDGVKNLFTFDSNNDSIKDTGIAVDMDNLLDNLIGVDGVIDSQEEYYEELIDDLNDQITDFEEILDMREANYRRQFTAMETAVAQLQNISLYVSSQLAGLTATKY
ncbi:MAG: flagellar filament capping protein FliD [Candidatus Hydrogenedentota bacterium]